MGYRLSEGNGEERDRFWNDMDRIVDANGYRLCIVGDLNRWIRDMARANMTGAFGAPGEKVNGIKVVEFCAERGLCMGNTYFEHRSLHKYSRLARDQTEWR